VGPFYVVPGAIPGQAQGVWVPAASQSNTLLIRIVGINTVSDSVSAAAVTGPNIPLGQLLPLVVRDRYTQCADSACQPPVGPAPPGSRLRAPTRTRARPAGYRLACWLRPGTTSFGASLGRPETSRAHSMSWRRCTSTKRSTCPSGDQCRTPATVRTVSSK